MAGIDELLLEIQTAMECSFLSDLHHIRQPLDAKSRVRIMGIPPNLYSLNVWNEAASYITGSSCSFSTAEEAKAGIAEGK